MKAKDARKWLLEQMQCCRNVSQAMQTATGGEKHAFLLASAFGFRRAHSKECPSGSAITSDKLVLAGPGARRLLSELAGMPHS